MTTRLLSPKELADRLGVSVGTLANGRVSGSISIPFVKVGKAVRYHEDDVNAFLERRKVRNTAEADALRRAA